MLWLAWQGVPKNIIELGAGAIREYQVGRRTDEEIRAREDVERTAEIVWRDLLNFGQFETGSKGKTQSFFRRHKSHWHHPGFKPAMRFLKDFELPTGLKPPFHQQPLIGRHLSAQGEGNPYLKDDLSERVTAADNALKRAGIRGRRALIAKALNESPLTRRANDSWEPEEVRDRVKAYQKQRNHLPGDDLADRWILSYRWAMQIGKISPAISPSPGTTKDS